MIRLPGIKVLTQIYESANSLVYRGLREQDNQPVILKRLQGDYPLPTELIRCQQEYDIIRHLNREGVEGIVKAYALQNYQNTLVMVLEDFGGESLKILQEKQPFTLSQFLLLVIQITEILSKVHHLNIIHKDINPSNIVFNPQTGQVKLIDFGISTVLSRENPSLKNPNVLEGTLAYMSPEQTGRMNRSLDYRSDFYSIGVTFYELLAKQLPFETTDALELVHCHIAKQPVPPQEVNPEIPKAVSEIVMKLLAKTAEERYQSAWGIKADLEECLNQFQKSGKIAEFPLGSQDISDKFQIPQKLYGREQDVETLLAAFERVAGRRDIKALSREEEENIPPSPLPGVSTSSFSTPRSPTEMMLVAGYCGIGKSALVHEIYKPITQNYGYFISGKFDQFQRHIPYSAVIQAFRELVQQLLTESEEQLQQWRETLLTALG
ncbi:MAG: AAA family ATPase, partial [Coleofasciculus sp. Co-bin14]|nr:AAA family ATPase [Coleofasciculus sp. Co-bin14]